MDEESDAFFNTGNGVAFSVVPSQIFLNTGNVGAIVIYAEISNVADTVSLYWLFGTGTNSADAPNIQLGFPEKADVGGPQTINGTFITYPMPLTYWKLYPNRYVDINLNRTPEFKPHSRVWLTRTDDFRRPRQNVAGVRLLVEPIRRLDNMKVSLTLADGTEPSIISNQGYNITYDLLLVSPEINIPKWVQQYLEY
jgi:hypothetical protein